MLASRILVERVLAKHAARGFSSERLHPAKTLLKGGALRDLEKDLAPDAALDLDKHLEAYVQAVVDALVQGPLAAARSSEDSKQAVAAIGEDLRMQLSSISCGRCANGGRACCGRDEDHALVAAAGECISTLKRLFRLACDAGTVLAVPMVSPAIEIVLTTQWKGTLVHDLPLETLNVVGKTRFLDEGNRRTSEVVLSFGSDFSWTSFLSIPYTLFHECVAHGFQGFGSPEPRAEPPEDSRFSEGWMDWVALHMLQRVLAEEECAEWEDCLTGFGDQAQATHSARTRYRDPKLRARAVAIAANRSIGADGAQWASRTVLSLASKRRSHQRTQDPFLELSFELNGLPDAFQGARDAFATLAGDPFDREGRGFAKQLLSDYLAGSAASDLCERVNTHIEAHAPQKRLIP